MRRGQCIVEINAMLLLLMQLTSAIVLQHHPRPNKDTLLLEPSIQMSDILPSVDSETVNTPPHPSSDTLLQSILMLSKNAEVRLRRSRAASKGCQFGTCQMHNLATTLYRMGQTNNKEQSKGAKDPNGYGR